MSDAQRSAEATGTTFPWRELVVLAFCSLLASPFCSAGAKLMLDGEYMRGIVGFAIGVPIGVVGITFHWWKDRISGQSYGWLLRTADRGWPLALGFAFLYVTGFFQSPASHPDSSSRPALSANEIADIVVQRLPKATVANNPAPPVAVPPYVNPIHTATSKWGLSSGLRSAIIHSNLPADCRITITRLPVTYAEDLAADLKSALDVVGWKYDEHLATTTVDKEVSIRALDGQGPTRECAMALTSRLQNDGRTRTGGSYNNGIRWLIESEAPDFLKHCASACIEVTIGNEDTSR
jgi:hypothetical protein